MFDILSFDMIVMFMLPFVPGCAEWIYKRGDAKLKLAISDLNSPKMYVYDVSGGNTEPMHTVEVSLFMHTINCTYFARLAAVMTTGYTMRMPYQKAAKAHLVLIHPDLLIQSMYGCRSRFMAHALALMRLHSFEVP